MIFSDEQQLLLNLVRIQFEDRPSFLSVDSITTSLSLSVSGGPNISISPSTGGNIGSNYDGLGQITSSSLGRNLGMGESYGISPNASYSDSPTITFTPLQGEKFTNQILSKLSLNTIFLLLNSGWNIDRVMRSFVENIGDYDNVAVVSRRAIPQYKKFIELVEYLQQLYEEKIIYYELVEI